MIKSIAGLKELPNLKKLHLRQNELEAFDEVPDLPALEYLNLRENKIENLEEVFKLDSLKGLKDLNMIGNPISDDKGDEFKKELLIVGFKSLTRSNKEEVTDDDKADAKALHEEREAERIQKE